MPSPRGPADDDIYWRTSSWKSAFLFRPQTRGSFSVLIAAGVFWQISKSAFSHTQCLCFVRINNKIPGTFVFSRGRSARRRRRRHTTHTRYMGCLPGALRGHLFYYHYLKIKNVFQLKKFAADSIYQSMGSSSAWGRSRSQLRLKYALIFDIHI